MPYSVRPSAVYTEIMERLIQHDSGRGRLVFENNEDTPIKYQIDEFQEFVSDGLGGELPTVRNIRGQVSHAEGHPDWHPILSLNPGPFTLVMTDERKLKVVLTSLQGSFRGTGGFF